MKKVLGLFIATVLMVVIALTATAEGEKVSGNFEYIIVNGEAHITKYLGNEEYVTIPGEIDEYPVTTVRKDTFSNNNTMEEVFISEGITTLQCSSFNQCTNLKTVSIPSTLTECEEQIFKDCFNIEKINIQSGMRIVPQYFYCRGVSCVEVVLPDTVEEIGYEAFFSSNIKKINLGNVKKIGVSAFSGCNQLTKVNIENVEYLSRSAFDDSGIESINIQKLKEWSGIENVSEEGKVYVKGAGYGGEEPVMSYSIYCATPFRCCDNLKVVRINYPEKYDGKLLISECSNIETVIIDNLPDNLSKWEFSCDIKVDNPKRDDSVDRGRSFDYYGYAQLGKMPPNMTIYGRGDAAKAYAESIGVPFQELIDVNLNSDRIWMDDCLPYIKNDRTLVPMRAIFEALGATVSWDNETRTAIGVKGGSEVKITIGENVLYKNGEAIELDSVAEITNDRTMVPVRAISEAFDYLVEWDNEAKIVNILDPYRRTYYTYDEDGQVIKTQNSPYPYHHEYLYDEEGNVIREWQRTAFKNSDRLFEYTYNEKGQRVSKSECTMWHTYGLITEDVPFEEVEKYFYDEEGRLSYAEYPTGGRRYYVYEEGKLIREENGEGKIVKKYVYNEEGRINYTESY